MLEARGCQWKNHMSMRIFPHHSAGVELLFQISCGLLHAFFQVAEMGLGAFVLPRYGFY